MSPNDVPVRAAPAGQKRFLSCPEVAARLKVTEYRVRQLGDDGELHPHRDHRNRRRYERSEVDAFALRLAVTAPKVAALDASILDLHADGKSIAEIVRALRIPIATVRASLLASEAKPPAADDVPRVETAEERAFLNQSISDLEADRARIRAGHERNRKDPTR